VDYPLVSVIMASRDRPTFLPVAMRCYAEQTWPNRELIVVDSGATHPVDEALVASVGGRVLRVTPGTPLGEKLNIGIRDASGIFIQKMDDDDYYAPTAIDRLVDALGGPDLAFTPRMIAGVSPYSILLLADWDMRLAPGSNIPGATLCFPRALWEEHPFPAVSANEDAGFVVGLRNRGVTLRAVNDSSLLVAIRHTGLTGDRAHTWVRNGSRKDSAVDPDAHIKAWRKHAKRPEEFLPPWTVDFYQALRARAGLHGGTP
jgi:glycosyltransferase involved in cell wall biosynthesis